MKLPSVLLPVFVAGTVTVSAAEFSTVTEVDAQPLAAQAKRLVQALEFVGAPLTLSQSAALEQALAEEEPGELVSGVQAVFDPLCLAGVNINPESRVKVAKGPADPLLTEAGWTVFLIKVHNEAGVTAALAAESPNARSLHNSPQGEVPDRWLDLATFDAQPLTRTLTGLELEYRILSLYSRDRGKREAKISFDVGQGTQDLGFRSELDVLFTCRPAHEIRLQVLDESGEPTTAAFEIRDELGRVYPSQAKRLAPDFAFHPQIYRADGERIRLGNSREVAVEIVVNGEAVAEKHIVANGKLRDLTFEIPIERSSWVAARILPSSHTNPVWVKVGDEPVRASRRSAEWCLRGVDDCWKQKEKFIAEGDMEDALEAYQHARTIYQSIIAESPAD